ncbi:hypothetical protein [Amycolatopsis coloradensis]|uniref:hypothetical protein n=1 Tax=Amycolatopsis coloradensis TaxID=76021 RepID=UPI001177905A|nr:hypothetical protein [Amycolatopsis coloradensis]
MTVYRRGIPVGSEDKKAVRLGLGRILVTIDDLEALLDHIREDEDTPFVEFIGGEFSSPEDLRRLKPDERRKLHIKTSRLEVTLSGDMASVFGQREACNSLVSGWAARRTTREFPPWKESKARRDKTYYKIMAFIGQVMSFMILTGILAITGVLDGTGVTLAECFLVSPLVAIIAFPLMISNWWKSKVLQLAPYMYCVIVPTTLEEYYRDRQEHRRHRNIIVVSTVGSVIAAAGVVVAIIALK